MNRVDFIRKEENKYHEKFYRHHRLFEKGSWLHKPVDTILELIPYIEQHSPISILDLGSGVGRNSIPLAELVKVKGGKIVCVDILHSALEQLIQNSEEYNVKKVIQTEHADIGDYSIKPNEFDLIIAVSSLEHVRSEEIFNKVIKQMAAGTKDKGINCIIVNSEVEELDLENNQKLDALFEINISTAKMLKKLKENYFGWEKLFVCVKPLEYHITRNGIPVLLKTNAITYVVKKANCPVNTIKY